MSKLRCHNGIKEKLCSSCQKWKPETEFSPGGASHRASEGGRHCQCKQCNAAGHRRGYAVAKALLREVDVS